MCNTSYRMVAAHPIGETYDVRFRQTFQCTLKLLFFDCMVESDFRPRPEMEIVEFVTLYFCCMRHVCPWKYFPRLNRLHAGCTTGQNNSFLLVFVPLSTLRRSAFFVLEEEKKNPTRFRYLLTLRFHRTFSDCCRDEIIVLQAFCVV